MKAERAWRRCVQRCALWSLVVYEAFNTVLRHINPVKRYRDFFASAILLAPPHRPNRRVNA
jgi:hypothetical protein